MPHTLTAPLAQPSATQWKVSDFHVLDMEVSGNMSLRVDLALMAADNVTVSARATFTVDDNAQFNTDMSNATGTTLAKIRKACYLAAVRQGIIGAGVGT